MSAGFHVPVGHRYVTGKMSLQIHCPFLNQIVWGFCLFCYWIIRVIYIFFYINPLSDIRLANIFSHLIGCLFIVFMVSFAVQNVLSLKSSHFFIFTIIAFKLYTFNVSSVECQLYLNSFLFCFLIKHFWAPMFRRLGHQDHSVLDRTTKPQHGQAWFWPEHKGVLRLQLSHTLIPLLEHLLLWTLTSFKGNAILQQSLEIFPWEITPSLRQKAVDWKLSKANV